MVRAQGGTAVAEERSGFSRRDILFGGLRRVRENLGEVAQMVKPEPKASTAPAPKPGDGGLPGRLAEGHAAYNACEYEAAVVAYRDCCQLDPEHADARRRLGYCLYRSGQFLQAKVELERALRILGKDNFTALYLGLCYARLDRAAEAVAAWREYFNANEVRIMREINLQAALLESPEPPLAADAADALEEAIELRKEELRTEQG
jgi:tetratricopeptide (TPR) repeat protein